MFNFIADLFRNERRANEQNYARSSYASATRKRTIHFDPTLINGLKKDHSGLVELFQRIWAEGYKQQDFRQLAHLLTLFKSSFQAHLIKENVRFYVYLEQSLADDVHSLQTVKDFRADMNDIASTVVHFCKRYTHEAFTAEMIQDFKRDYQKVGEALTRRVSLEERELYTLYQPG